MAMQSRFAHINLIANDWRRLARFYQEAFGCVPVPPERELEGELLERATGVHGAAIRGSHLRLPGYGEDGPTLEIFEYDHGLDAELRAVNRQGFAHLAFAVEDVNAARDAVLEAGGQSVGEIVTLAVSDTHFVRFVYVADPEGNILEIQRWLDGPAANTALSSAG
jgi:predicted enzyme related to lactoylglutathione lyase